MGSFGGLRVRSYGGLFLLVGWSISWLVGWSLTLCSSALGQATDKLKMVLERRQIAHEDPTIKNQDCPSQESGTSFMSPKGHILI